MFRDLLAGIIGRGLATGAIHKTTEKHGREQASFTTFQWDMGGTCRVPVERTLAARPDLTAQGDKRFPKHQTLYLQMLVRCRKCDPCRKWKADDWRSRARNEYLYSHRTWFGTLTVSPENHQRAYMEACLRAYQSGIDPGEWSFKEEALERDSALYPEVQLWWKRIRKESRVKMKYICVTEFSSDHQNGHPHFHLLIHEQYLNQCVRHKCLNDQWKLGHANFKLVDSVRAANYVCKYLTKDATARVRASGGYGKVRPAERRSPALLLPSQRAIA